ncbi:MAG: hypothetical protein LRZ85_00340 [Alphaproteobacteria bacterium]|nr:hypothetical protein [Alphaproteobacteria bacterium]
MGLQNLRDAFTGLVRNDARRHSSALSRAGLPGQHHKTAGWLTLAFGAAALAIDPSFALGSLGAYMIWRSAGQGQNIDHGNMAGFIGTWPMVAHFAMSGDWPAVLQATVGGARAGAVVAIGDYRHQTRAAISILFGIAGAAIYSTYVPMDNMLDRLPLAALFFSSAGSAFAKSRQKWGLLCYMGTASSLGAYFALSENGSWPGLTLNIVNGAMMTNIALRRDWSMGGWNPLYDPKAFEEPPEKAGEKITG